LLLLDRGFYRVAVIRYRQAARYPFIMPVLCRGRRAADPRGPRGTRVFATHQRHGGFRYTLTRANQRTATVLICVHCRNWQGRRNRHGRPTLVYACWGVSPTPTPWVYPVYRQRFGIETSYRQLQEARIKTAPRDPLLRLLCVGIALRLRNVWVWVQWHCLSTPRRGGRQLHRHSLRFATLLLWLVHLAEQTFGSNDSVVVRRLP
jgi:hypothetical protein